MKRSIAIAAAMILASFVMFYKTMDRNVCYSSSCLMTNDGFVCEPPHEVDCPL